MNITNIIVQNFASFKGEKITLEETDGRYHAIIVGENGCGKTNIVRALQFIINHWDEETVNHHSSKIWNNDDSCQVGIEIRLTGEDLEAWKAFHRFAGMDYPEYAEMKIPSSLEIGFADLEITSDFIVRYIIESAGQFDVESEKQKWRRSTRIASVDIPELRTKFVEADWKAYRALSNLMQGGNKRLSVFEVVGAILRRRIAFVREGRGLFYNEITSHNTFNLQTTALQLFKHKNGDQNQLAKLKEMQAMFNRFFPQLTPDVVFDIRGHSEEGISGQPMIIYRGQNENGPVSITVDNSSGGMNDVLMLLAAMFIGEASVVIVDEITRSLHSTLKHLASKIIQQSKLCILMVTHDAEMVSEATVRSIIRLHRDKTKGTVRLPAIKYVPKQKEKKNDETGFWKFICDPIRLPAFFARGILFVEGPSEVRFFQALVNLILQGEIPATEVDLTNFHFLWEVIPLTGAGGSKNSIRLMNMWKHLPHLFLLDWDNFVQSADKGVRLTWNDVDWKRRTLSNLFNHLPEESKFEVLRSTEKPDSWEDMYKAFMADPRFKQFFVWPMDVYDIEGVCGLTKNVLSGMPFADLQEHIKLIFDGSAGRRDALLAFVKQLVLLHKANE